MPLTKKYYKLIAKVINNNINKFPYNKLYKDYINKEHLISDLAMEFRADNKLFNSDKFIEACNE
jgi:hypothetical protein